MLAPVCIGRANASDGTGLMLLSVDRARCDAIMPWMQEMTSKVVWLGEGPERAASFKMFGNLVLIGMGGVLGDVADRQAGIANGLGGATGREQFHAGRHQGAGEGNESGLVGDGKQGALETRHTRAA